MNDSDEIELQNARQSRAHHERMASEKSGAARKRQLRLMQHYDNVISAIMTRIAKKTDDAPPTERP